MVLVLIHINIPSHTWNHFGGLGNDLSGERDELERFVLKPRGHDVGEGGERVFVEGRSVARLIFDDQDKAGHEKGRDSVHENQELRVGEFFADDGHVAVLSVGNRHDALLKDAPREKRRLQTHETKRQRRRLAQKGIAIAGY